MRIMKEMVEVVNKSPTLNKLETSPVINPDTRFGLGKESDLSYVCQNQELSLPHPDYLNLVREQKERNYTKEQLLSAVQVSYARFEDLRPRPILLYTSYNF